MSNQLYSGQGRDINVFAGQSLAVSSITGAYTATIIAGAGIGTALATDSTGGATYGPYSGGVTIRLKAGEGALLDYEAAVNPVLNYAGPARLGYSAEGDTSSVVSGDRNIINFPGAADSILTSYGATGYDISRAVSPISTMGIGTTDLTHSVTNDYPRFSNYTRKCVLGATGTSQIRFYQFTPFAADPDDLAFSVDVYIENYVTEFAGASNAYIDIELSASTTTSLGANYSRWSFNATCLRQGWNTLKVRSADTVSFTAGAGNLPQGVTRPADVGTGFNFANESCGYMAIRFNNMPSQNVYIDQFRLPAKAKPILVIGFDASGSGNDDNIFLTKVAPLFAANGFRSYCTFTNIYELIFSGSTAWKRLATLYNTWGWDVINHTWNHGATIVGTNTTLASLVAASDVVTLTFTNPHGVTVGLKVKGRIRGSSIAVTNVVTEWDVISTTTMRATIASAGSATATGTITFNTFLGEVLSTDTAENRRIALHEFADTALTMRGTGFARGALFCAYPNNSYAEKAVVEYAFDAGRIRLGRSDRNGFTNVNEFGIDNPQAMGSWVMNSGASGTQTSVIQAKVEAAISRGDHIQIYGHFILDDTDPANSAYFPLPANGSEYPPAMNGNPNPPSASLSSTGGWWYYSQLKKLVDETIAPAVAAGTLRVMSPSEYAAYMGYTQ
jgi:hypothetical protein